MTIELNEYGLMIDLGDFLYVSLGWAFIILTAIVLVGAKVYNKIKNKENKVVEPYLHREDNSLWGTNEQTTNYPSAISPSSTRPIHGAHCMA